MMRDDPTSKEIPERFEPSKWNLEKLEEATAFLATLLGMSDDAKLKARDDWWEEKVASDLKYAEEQEAENQMYRDMMTKVEEWKPPTHDHNGLQEFMLEQLRTSISDGGWWRGRPKDEMPSVEKWHREKVQSTEKDILYHEEEHGKELSRTANRNLWLKTLRISLGL